MKSKPVLLATSLIALAAVAPAQDDKAGDHQKEVIKNAVFDALKHWDEVQKKNAPPPTHLNWLLIVGIAVVVLALLGTALWFFMKSRKEQSASQESQFEMIRSDLRKNNEQLISHWSTFSGQIDNMRTELVGHLNRTQSKSTSYQAPPQGPSSHELDDLRTKKLTAERAAEGLKAHLEDFQRLVKPPRAAGGGTSREVLTKLIEDCDAATGSTEESVVRKQIKQEAERLLPLVDAAPDPESVERLLNPFRTYPWWTVDSAELRGLVTTLERERAVIFKHLARSFRFVVPVPGQEFDAAIHEEGGLLPTRERNLDGKVASVRLIGIMPHTKAKVMRYRFADDSAPPSQPAPMPERAPSPEPVVEQPIEPLPAANRGIEEGESGASAGQFNPFSGGSAGQ